MTGGREATNYGPPTATLDLFRSHDESIACLLWSFTISSLCTFHASRLTHVCCALGALCTLLNAVEVEAMGAEIELIGAKDGTIQVQLPTHAAAMCV